jgi:YD repeat-containing protein
MNGHSDHRWKRRLILLSVAVGLMVWDLLSSPVVHAATWTNTYDVMNRLSGRTDPLGRSEKYAYDLVGESHPIYRSQGAGHHLYL